MRGVKEYKQKSVVSGLSIKKILEMTPGDLNKLGKKDLQKITGRLVSAGNKRIRRAEEKNITSPAFAYIRDNGGVFSTKGKNLNQLRSEFARARNFLTAETSTIKGAEKFRDESIANLKEVGVNISPENFDKVMSAYETLRRSDKSIIERGLKYSVLNEIETMVDTKLSEDEILADITKRLKDIYKKEQDKIDYGVGQYFTIDDENELPF